MIETIIAETLVEILKQLVKITSLLEGQTGESRDPCVCGHAAKYHAGYYGSCTKCTCRQWLTRNIS